MSADLIRPASHPFTGYRIQKQRVILFRMSGIVTVHVGQDTFIALYQIVIIREQQVKHDTIAESFYKYVDR